MHNKYATFFLPVLAGLAIVGAGFSTWVFGNQTHGSKSANGTAIIAGEESSGPTVKLELGYVSSDVFTPVTNPEFTLTLDQGGVSSATNPDAGISFAWTGEHADELTANGLSFQWSISSEDRTAYSNYTVTIAYSVTLDNVGDGKILDYVKLTTPASLPSGSQEVGVSTLPETGKQYFATNLTPTAWSYTNKPGSLTAYQSMLSDLGLTYSASNASGYTSTQKIAFTFDVTTTFTLK